MWPGQRVRFMHLEHFNSGEFRHWWPYMSHRLLTMLDTLRHKLDTPIYISDNVAALGRHLSWNNESEHNMDRWGEVLAADCFIRDVRTASETLDVVNTAKDIGFTGIGIYPDWINNSGKNQVGFHFGVRPTRKMGDPALWGRVENKYVRLDEALKYMVNK